MEIIDELEATKRGVYGGAVGYISWSGEMDTAIAFELPSSAMGPSIFRPAQASLPTRCRLSSGRRRSTKPEQCCVRFPCVSRVSDVLPSLQSSRLSRCRSV